MKKQFTWSPFSLAFVKSICYSEKTPKMRRPKFETDSKDSLIPYIDRICAAPDEHFVKRYREELVAYFFADSTHLVSLIRALEKQHYRGVHTGSMEQMLAQLRRLRMTSTVLTLILAELWQEGLQRTAEEEDISVFNCPKSLDLTACIPDELTMHGYQDQAIAALHTHFVTNNRRAGILCMPTGSGKTRIATAFLLKSMVASGWQVIWLAHRAMLIDQAASSIYTAAGALLPLAARDKETFKMVCVSGSHASIKATEANDDVMICGVQTLVRNLPYLQAVIGKKVMVIVDEAHHTLAPSYRLILKEISKTADNVKLLGLTATPKRISDLESTRLLKIFDDTVIYSVAMGELIAKGFLSTPHYERVDTNIDFNTTITLDEKKYIQKWGELSPETLARMSRITERNKLIADTYMRGKAHYGKTLIFALNAEHCISLCEELRERGVRCDYIYCTHEGNADKIARFQRGELDVLVNIQVLTEGSDVPDIATVFLTRPTQSDVLLMQMIGRGMRGPSSHGTADVSIVDFHDNWGTFAEWLNPKFIIDDIVAAETVASEKGGGNRAEVIPWAMIRDILDGIHTNYVGGELRNNCAELPVGWYDVLDEDGNDRKVLVFQSQLGGYVNMAKSRKTISQNSEYTGQQALHDWFGGFGLMPSTEDLQMVLMTMRLTDEPLHLHQFKERKRIDASVLAGQIKENNIGIATLDTHIGNAYAEHAEIIDSIYGSLDSYARRVKEFLMYPDGQKPLGAKIEELPEESLTLDRTPIYDIDELVSEVVVEQFNDAYGKLPPVFWTKRPLTSYFGKYQLDPSGDYIYINSALNSKDVPRDVVKYILYHELLHRDNRTHDTAFHALEHRYPGWTEHERFLDHIFPKFDIRSAM